MAVTITSTETRRDFADFPFPSKYVPDVEMKTVDIQAVDEQNSFVPVPTSPSHVASHQSSFAPLLQQEEEPLSTTSQLSFLDLPLEIRLQIYSYLLPIHPAKHPHLSPNTEYPPPTSSAYFLRVLSPALALSYPDFEPAGKTEPSSFQSTKKPASNIKGHGCGQVPSAMLRSCKQIYDEARMIPWETNEFIFINWFCSGVYAARAFLRSLQPWQRDAMRWARLEVLGRDLKDSWVATMVGGRAGGGEWIDLCGLWAGSDSVEGRKGGLQGLRLGIKGRVGCSMMAQLASTDGSIISNTEEGAAPLPRTGSNPPSASEARGIVLKRDLGVLEIDSEWVTKGLTRMTSLRYLEVEIEDDEVEREIKVDFCVKLGERLSTPERKVEVVFVEKVEPEPRKPKAVMAWGEPGDDYIWALDS